MGTAGDESPAVPVFRFWCAVSSGRSRPSPARRRLSGRGGPGVIRLAGGSARGRAPGRCRGGQGRRGAAGRRKRRTVLRAGAMVGRLAVLLLLALGEVGGNGPVVLRLGLVRLL